MFYRLLAFAGFALTTVAANWMVTRWGIVSVGFGLTAPAGVYAAGLAFGLRDILHELGGRAWVLAAIAVGALISYVIEDGITIPGGYVAIAVASAAAFTLSELADLAVYEPLNRRAGKVLVERQIHGYGYVVEERTPFTDHKWWIGAVVASNLVGAVIDSALFLWLAFGSLEFLAGQVWGKALMVAPAVLLMWVVRRNRRPAMA